jgi:flagellar hook protein FlgE
MMSSFFSAASGIKAQQYALDVIANNIANVNTTGYKQQRVSFADLLSQTISAASSSTDTTGGTNPTQIGLGVGIASTDLIMTVGSTQSTGVDTDCSISGDGFFIVQGGSEGEYQFTRAGNFTVDEDGNLTVNGYKVCGWEQKNADGTFNTDAAVEALNLYSDDYNGNKKVIAASTSTEADFSGTLDSSATASGTALNEIGTTPTSWDKTTSVTVYDAQGNSYDVTVEWKKCYADSGTTSWYWEASSDDGLTLSPSSGYVEFDSSGKIITTDSTNYNTTPTITLTPDDAGVTSFDVTMDFGDVTMTSSSSSSTSTSAWSNTTDGYPAGTLQSLSVESDGTIVGVYSNDQTQALGQIALATFANQEGLEKIGDNLYATSANSGDFTAVVAGTSGSGGLSSGTLEMSNVDLAEQFSEMMISQRAYQANSKMITASDECLQSLIGMVK